MDSLIQLEPAAPRLPGWLRANKTHFPAVHELKAGLRSLGLHTVCESARCPNLHECFHAGRATFMILGNLCTRGCGFCSVPKSRRPLPLDSDEPANVARQALAMGLRYVVITSVNRDDLPDGGSEHFAKTVREVHAAIPGVTVEVLTPDFQGEWTAVARVLDAAPDVFNHNVETVPRLYRAVRPQADYPQSLRVLSFAKRHRPERLTKSGAMLGLGETVEEVHQLLRDLKDAAVDIVTLGQYLQPARRNLRVAEYILPARFDAYRDYGMSLGFRMVFSGPLVRSSYMADSVHGQALA